MLNLEVNKGMHTYILGENEITHHVRVFIFSQDVCMHAFVGF
jgi:hypothetical protein